MRGIIRNKKAVSNVLGYLISFTIASIVMVSAVYSVGDIVNEKQSEVARIQALNLANKIADAITECGQMWEATNVEYEKTIDLPLNLAGKKYFIEASDAIYVKTTDGSVNESCTIYNTD